MSIMKTTLVLVGTCMLLLQLVKAQEPVQLGKNSSDCLGAITISDTAIGPVYSAPGWGNKLEITGYELGDPMFIQQEHNTVWYRFVVPYDAVLTFDLVPKLPDDDFDFMLFKYSGPNFCQEIAEGKVVPVRSNISRKNIEVRGMTGLREGEVNDYVPSGPGSSYSRPMKVKKGETYYLLVDNPFRENEGHSIYLHYRRVGKDIPLVEEDKPQYQIPMTNLRIDVVDNDTGLPVGANISIDGVMMGKAIEYKAQSSIFLEVMSYKTYTINCVRQGFMLTSKNIVPKTDSLYKVEVRMQKIRPGAKVTLDNIKFESDKTDVLRKSESALNQLRDFMTENPDVSVEIQGHVNGPGKKNKKEYRQLSDGRAKSVYDYLIGNGVPPSRLRYKGYGNAQMLFPEPLNNYQAEANRRVEILIL